MADVSTATLGDYQVDIATDFGPRVVGLHRAGGPQILAQLAPDVGIEHPGGRFRFHGGHRLWAAPERAEITYANDDHPCQVVIGEGSVTISADRDAAGVRKEVTVTADDDSLIVAHSIAWQSTEIRAPLAAWAITQLPLGGTALVPLEGPDTSPLPNRQLILWPYTSPADERIRYGNRGLEVMARGQNRLKLGVGPALSFLGYLWNGWLFTKRALSRSGGEIPDHGAGNQVYVGQGFCELETVGGLSQGPSAHITERWKLQPCGDLQNAWAIVGEGQA